MNEQLIAKIKASENIWFAIEHIGAVLGEDVKDRLEELVKQEKNDSNRFNSFMDAMKEQDRTLTNG
jgi:hypothetical protein